MAKKFNWQGITENSDGTFTAENKRAKTRLLKEFHKQGVAVRSTKIEGDGYTVSPVGAITKKSITRRPALGYRPRTVYPRRISRPAYHAPPRIGPSGMRPRPLFAPHQQYAAPPRVRGPGVLSKIGGYFERKRQERMQRTQQEIELKQNLAESEAKLKAERITAERAETVRQIREQETTSRLQRERAELTRHQIAERMRARESQHDYSDSPNTPRYLPKEKKVDYPELQRARTDAIEGK
jgi:hypothetical protein